ncbi:MAG: nuclear transport factor 2 family protein [Bacteroidota bacterium]|nr:nuclear transport factor 2 family protein [Bacteroidota bacterium]
MIKKVLLVSACSLLTLSGYACYANIADNPFLFKITSRHPADTIPRREVMDVVKAAIHASNSFNEQTVADLYTPNAVVADDEPPYSWNGPTAGIQWINAVERAVKENRIRKFKAEIEQPSIYQQTNDNVYVVVPVTYTGDLPGGDPFSVRGAFTFVLRQINDKWLIKSQVWMREKGL